MPKESVRTFIALEIEERTREEIAKIQDAIKQTNSLKGSWVMKSNLHLTLKFLGDTQIKYIDKIKEGIKQCFINESVIECNLSGIGVFPNEKYPRVIWVGIEDENARIKNFAKRLEDYLFLTGFKKENKDFKTHITICRPKQIINHSQFKSVLEEINRNSKPMEFIISKITFFESKLTPQGSIYTPLYNYLLQ